ncbi:hypothetical protein AB9P05_19715 [Roseivirga sp. BDSF3-8]|uniref:hypothetical protein n=1 Tax=Roseivirga sp. BDSF3-8 TaxID=3241598 RepID=UPI00353205E6
MIVIRIYAGRVEVEQGCVPTALMQQLSPPFRPTTTIKRTFDDFQQYLYAG